MTFGNDKYITQNNIVTSKRCRKNINTNVVSLACTSRHVLWILTCNIPMNVSTDDSMIFEDTMTAYWDANIEKPTNLDVEKPNNSKVPVESYDSPNINQSSANNANVDIGM